MGHPSLWYRHWLEIRGGLSVALAGVTILCFFYPIMLHGSSSWFAESGRVISELSALAPELPAMGPDRFFPWGVHVQLSTVAALIAGIFLAGTGIRTNDWSPRHPSVYYTLMLPVSRFEMIWTRFATACAAAFLLFAVMLILDSAALLAMGHTVPLGPMAQSSFFAGLLVVLIMAAFGLLNLWDDRPVGTIWVMAIIAAFYWKWTPASDLVAGTSVPWTVVAVIVGSITATQFLSALIARKRDF